MLKKDSLAFDGNIKQFAVIIGKSSLEDFFFKVNSEVNINGPAIPFLLFLKKAERR